MTEFTPIMIGATLLLAGGAVGVMSVLSPKARAVFVYAQLVLMAGIYVGFAIASLDAADIIRRSDWSALLLESIVALGFCVCRPSGLAIVPALVVGGVDTGAWGR